MSNELNDIQNKLLGNKIVLVQEIIKGGIATILSVGLIILFGIQAWIQHQQLDIMRQNMERQTRALEEISKTYRGG